MPKYLKLVELWDVIFLFLLNLHRSSSTAAAASGGKQKKRAQAGTFLHSISIVGQVLAWSNSKSKGEANRRRRRRSRPTS